MKVNNGGFLNLKEPTLSVPILQIYTDCISNQSYFMCFIPCIQTHHLLINIINIQYSQQNILIMFITPTKSVQPPQNQSSSLKQTIENKLQGRNTPLSKNMDQMATEQFRQEDLKLLEMIDFYQSKESRGYFTYNSWIDFNTELFGHVPNNIIVQFWKILRIINYGQVKIPTGLIYQIATFITYRNLQKQAKSSIHSLKDVVNCFLKTNQTKDLVSGFRELQSYLSFEQIEKYYCPQMAIKQKNVIKNNVGNNRNENKQDVFERMFKQARKREFSLQKQKYESMVAEAKDCIFTPTISAYNTGSKVNIERNKCRHNKMMSYQPEKELFCQFIARKVDKKIYQSSIESIPGAQKHILKNIFCEVEKQRVQRYLLKPWLNMH